MSGPIGSAVILPDTEPSPRPAKRRQSYESDSAPKRPRTSQGDASAGPRASHEESPQPTDRPSERPLEKQDPNAARRKTSVQEEKKRGQRLFGGLLSTLSQSTPNGQQKRRQEIEKRQQEKAKQQKAADEVRRAERLANLKVVRKAEQIKFDEQSMRIRHSNLLAMAHYLSTKTQPALYYKPWQLLPGNEEQIKTQISDAETTIDREVQEFYTKYPERAIKESIPVEKVETNEESTSNETVGELGAESLSVPVSDPVTDTTNPVAQAPPSDNVKAEEQAEEEHNGEVVVENEEDTVIY